MSEKQLSHKASKLDHSIFIAVTLIYWSTLYVYVPILSPYLESRGFAYSIVGIVLGSYGFMQIVIRFPLGLWSDRLRVRRPFLALGMLTGALSCFLFSIDASWQLSIVARAVSGVSASCWVAFTVLYASYFRQEEASRSMGNISLMTVGGQLGGMAISGWLADRWGWVATFQVGIVIGAIGFLLSLFIREPKGGVTRTPIRTTDLASVVRLPLLRKVSILSILAHSVLFITMFGFTPSQAIVLGANRADLTFIVFAFMVPHAIASFASGRWLAPKFGEWRIIVVGFFLSAACTWLINLVPSLGWLAVTQAFNGLAQGLHMPLLLALAIRDVEQDKRATAMGFYQAIYAFGMFAGPFIAGWLIEAFGLGSGFALGAISALLASGLTVFWSKKPKLDLGQN